MLRTAVAASAAAAMPRITPERDLRARSAAAAKEAGSRSCLTILSRMTLARVQRWLRGAHDRAGENSRGLERFRADDHQGRIGRLQGGGVRQAARPSVREWSRRRAVGRLRRPANESSLAAQGPSAALGRDGTQAGRAPPDPAQARHQRPPDPPNPHRRSGAGRASRHPPQA
jgi:hypothetical protein